MTSKPVRLAAAAGSDVAAISRHDAWESGTDPAPRFAGALEHAVARIREAPASASSRYDHELGVPGLRAWPLRRFPHIASYIERSETIDIIRVSHGGRDLAEALEPGP